MNRIIVCLVVLVAGALARSADAVQPAARLASNRLAGVAGPNGSATVGTSGRPAPAIAVVARSRMLAARSASTATPCGEPAASCCAPAPPCCPPPCCPKPSITYHHRRGCCCSVCCGCCPPPPIQTTLVACNPCDKCPVEIPICVPGCTTGSPKVCYDNGFLGRNVEWFEWPNGFAVKVVFKHTGDLIVTSYGS